MFSVETDKPMLQKLKERSKQRDILDVASECDIGFVYSEFDDEELRKILQRIKRVADPLHEALRYVLQNRDKVALVVLDDWFTVIKHGRDWAEALKLWEEMRVKK